MRYKEFGKTGMNVSQMCLGTWGFGGVGWDNYPTETRMDALWAAVEKGINFLDTAPAYNGGAAEEFLGNALKEIGRERFLITTKTGNEFVNPTTYRRCGHREDIIRICEDSLRRLQTDYIDLLLVHWPDPEVDVKETMSAMQYLKDTGKIRHIGVSNFSKAQIEEGLEVSDIEALEPQFSMVHTTDMELMKWTASKGIANMTYGSIGGGILTGKYRTLPKDFIESDSRNRFYKHFHEPMFSQVMKLLKVCDEIAEQRGVPVVQVAINWADQRDYVHTCIIGAQTRDKIEQNCASFDWELTPEEITRLDEAETKYIQ